MGSLKGFETINPLPDGVEIIEIASSAIDVVLFFMQEESEFEARLEDLPALPPDAGA